MANTYDNGNVVRCTATFTQSNAPIDPAAVFFVAQKPDKTSLRYTYGTDAAIVKDQTGTYHVDLPIDQDRVWKYRFYATGTGQSSAQSGFLVMKDTLT